MRLAKVSIMAAAGVLAIAPSAVAQETSTWGYVTPFLATAFFPGSIGEPISSDGISIGEGSFDPSPGFGVLGGVRFKERFGIEGVFTYLPSNLRNPTNIGGAGGIGFDIGIETNILIYGATILYAFYTDKTAVTPFLVAGAGGIAYNPKGEFSEGVATETNFQFHFGGGVEVPLSRRVLLRGDARDYINSTDGEFRSGAGGTSKTQHNIVLDVGVSIVLGNR